MYTGWVVNSQPNGRGSWVDRDGKVRIDGLWKDGKLHGLGRIVYLSMSPQEAWQGFFECNNATEGTDKFRSSSPNYRLNRSLHKWMVVS